MSEAGVIAALCGAGRQLASQGLLRATSGNLSARLGDGSVVITASGRDKGGLGPADFVLLDHAGRPLASGRPSDEAHLHARLYARDPGIGAVLHVHSLAAAVLSRRHAPDGVLWLEGWEMMKALPGVRSHHHREPLPIVANDQDMAVLGEAIEAALDTWPQAHAVLIAGHGLTTWAPSVRQAVCNIEALDWLLNCALHVPEGSA